MLYKPSSPHFSTLETIWLFLNLIRLKSPVDSVMSLFYHMCFPVAKSWGSEFFKGKHLPFPLSNHQVVHSRLCSPLVLCLSSLYFCSFSLESIWGTDILQWASCSYFFFHACFFSLPYFLSDNWGFWDCKELEDFWGPAIYHALLRKLALLFREIASIVLINRWSSRNWWALWSITSDHGFHD